jgi:hypothetical protein
MTDPQKELLDRLDKIRSAISSAGGSLSTIAFLLFLMWLRGCK